jgi:Tfp pilus assembly protein PilO
MPRSFNLNVGAGNLNLPAGWTREPRYVARAVLGGLLLANLIAAIFVFKPFGGSAADLDAELASLQRRVIADQAAMQRMRVLVTKMDTARDATDQFMQTYFMDRRTASSSIISELNRAAKESGIRNKGEAFVFEGLDGSDTISMMTITANYEGTYGDLLQFVNRLDKSPRFLILAQLAAAPQPNTNLLAVAIKANTFVNDRGMVPSLLNPEQPAQALLTSEVPR